MLKPRSRVCSVLFVLALNGCAIGAGPPSQAEVNQADYGTPISQADAEAQAKEFLSRTLLDPYSAVYEFGTVAPGWRRDATAVAPLFLTVGGAVRFGYRLTATVNAKNRFGGYTGAKRYEFLFFNGRLTNAYAD